MSCSNKLNKKNNFEEKIFKVVFTSIILMMYFLSYKLYEDKHINFSIILLSGGLCLSLVFLYYNRKIKIKKENYIKKINTIKEKDSVSGFYNRNEFLIKANEYLTSKYFLTVISLNNVRKIQETLGNEILDAFIKEISLEIKSNNPLLSARLNECDFCCIFEKYSSNEKFIQDFSKKLEKEYYLKEINESIFASFNFGIILDIEDDIDVVLKKAHIALKNSKNKINNSYSLYSNCMKNAIDYEELILERDVRKCLEKNEINFLYQPQFNEKNEIISYEVLIRWNRKDKPLLNTEYFVSLLEKTGMIHSVGEYIIKENFKLYSKIKRINPLIKIAINLSPIQLLNENLISFIEEQKLECELEASDIEFEITESSFIDYTEQIISFFYELKKKGFNIALDDFGTGYSSFSYLNRIPLDKIKIDKSFIQNIDNNFYNQEIVKMLILLSHNLGLKVVSEGVENKKELDVLINMESDIYQGYYFSKPLSISDFMKLLESPS